jgi:PAS domain S-box-containing protein
MRDASLDELVSYKILLDSLNDITLVLDEQGIILAVNLAAGRALGLQDADLAGKPIGEVLPIPFRIEEIEHKPESEPVIIQIGEPQRHYQFCVTPLADPVTDFHGYLAALRDVTEQKEMEDILQTERNLLAKTLDTIDALIIFIDRHGCIVRVNRACEQFFGYSKDELVRKRVWDLLLHSQDTMTIRDMFANLQAGLSPFQYANRWVTRAGVSKTIAWSSSLILDETSTNIQYIAAIGLDITDKKNIEKLLEHERILLRGLIDSIPDLIFYKDINGFYLGWNAAFDAYRKPGVERDAGKYKDEDLYPPDLAKQFEESDQQVLETGQAQIYENWTENAGGQPVLLETHKNPYYGPGGEIMGVIGIGRDITRHRLVENALREANLEIEQLISSLSSILITITSDLCITRWNKKAQEIFGIDLETVIGQPLQALGIDWEWDSLAAGLEKCNRELKTIFLDPLRFRRVKGDEGFLGFNISPVFGNEDILTGYILLGADITEKIIQEARQAQAQKLESIGQLAAGIAHEINTPIQYIGDNTRFLQQSFATLIEAIACYDRLLSAARLGQIAPALITDLEATLQKADLQYLIGEVPIAINQTLEGIQRVAEIVRAMKGFSHPGVKKKTAIQLNKLLQDTITVARNEWKYVADIVTDFEPDLPMVVCLPGEINQVFLNIIVNAANAIQDVVGDKSSMHKGTITIRTRHDQDWVEIRISDTGTGIPKAIRNRIFEPFFTTKEVGKGTGQGLAIAYDIVEVKHRGTLTFETKMGVGTTFVIRLPIEPESEPGEV